MRITPDRAAANRNVQELASSEVAAHFAIEQDGPFNINTILIKAI